MTEEQIERAAERRMDGLDRRLMAGQLTQADYDQEVCDLDRWVQAQARSLPATG